MSSVRVGRLVSPQLDIKITPAKNENTLRSAGVMMRHEAYSAQTPTNAIHAGTSVVLWWCILAIESYRNSRQLPFLNSKDTREFVRLALALPPSPTKRRPGRVTLSPLSARRSLRLLVSIPPSSRTSPLSMHPQSTRIRGSFVDDKIGAESFLFCQICIAHNSWF